MRFSRSLFATVTLVVICGLFIATVAEGQSSGAEEDRQFTDNSQQRDFVVPVVYAAGAVGVILLGWYWLRLAGVITSIAEHLKDDGTDTVGAIRSLLLPLRIKQMDKFCKAVNERLDGCSNRIDEYERQIKELRIQVQLSKKREKNIEAILNSSRRF